MQTDLRGRDLISLQEWTKEEIDTVLEVALQLKRERALGIPHPLLRDRVLAMLFFFSSTRTRASFEAGMAQLGGHAQFIESRTTQISHGDTAREIGEILGRYNDGIAIRNVDWGVGNQYIRDVAAASRVPVLNMQCDLFHPHQSLADLLTMQEKKGDLRGRTIAISWAYAASYQKPISVPVDLSLLTTRYGMHVRLVHPPEFRLPAEQVAQAAENARRSGGSFELMDDFDAGMRGVDVVYAKSWGAMLTAKDETDGAEIAKKYTDWIADERRIGLAAEDAIYMHPLPADAGSRWRTRSSTARTRSSTTRRRTGSTSRRRSWRSRCADAERRNGRRTRNGLDLPSKRRTEPAHATGRRVDPDVDGRRPQPGRSAGPRRREGVVIALDREIAAYYERGREKDRLRTGAGLLEYQRTQNLLRRFLPVPPARVLDVGGGPGRYAAWLAVRAMRSR